MLPRIAWNTMAIVLRKHKMLHQSASCMKTGKITELIEQLDLKNDTKMMKSATNFLELFSVISKNVKHFTAEETLTALKRLVEIQKHTRTPVNGSDILRNPDFEKLCQSVKRNADQLELNDAIEALKNFSFPGVGTRATTEARTALLNRIKSRINDANVGTINFLSILLRQMEPNDSADALQTILPELLEIQISKNMGHISVTQLIESLNFVIHYRVSKECTVNIVNALALESDNLSPEQAKKIIWWLSSPALRIPMADRDKLLANSIRVMIRNFSQFDFDAVLTTLAKMINKYIEDTIEFEKFYDEDLYNKCADFVVAHDLGFENATFLQRRFNKLGFVHHKLISYMLMDKHSKLISNAKPISLMSLVTTMSHANFKPDNWNNIRSCILRNKCLTNVNDTRSNIPWVKLSIELLSLGIESSAIWNKVFSNEFLKVDLKLQRNKRLLRILELYQHVKVMTSYDVDKRINTKYLIEAKELLGTIVDNPLQYTLESAFGGPSFVCTKVRTQLGHIIDHVIAFDKRTMEPLRIADGSNRDVLYESIAIDKDKRQCLAVISYPRRYYCINKPTLKGIYELRLRTYEKMGIDVVTINHSMWNELLYDEKIAYLKREVRQKLEQLQAGASKTATGVTGIDQRDIIAVYENVRKESPPFDSTSGESGIYSLVLTTDRRKSLEILDSMKISSKPSSSEYSAVIQRAIQEPDEGLVWNLLNDMVTKCDDFQNDVFMTYIDYCEKNPSSFTENIDKMLTFICDNRIVISTEVAKEFQRIFHKFNYNCSISTVSKQGMCKACQKRLGNIEVTVDEFNDLSSHFFDKIFIEENHLSKSTPQELGSFIAFIDGTRPYDCVIDGLNIAFLNQTSNLTAHAKSLAGVVKHFVSQNKRVLVIGRKHMTSWPKAEMDFIRNNAKMYLTENASQDDLFFLYSTLKSGQNTDFVTNDAMRDHALPWDKNLRTVFRRWQEQHRYKVRAINDHGRITIAEPVKFDMNAQQLNGCWHLPFEDGLHCTLKENYLRKKWLCVSEQRS